MINDEELLRHFAKKDTAAFEIIVKTYFPILCRFAEKFLPDTSLAKDIAQETFIKLWQYEGKFQTCQGLKSFLFTVTKNSCLNLQRGREREEIRNKENAGLQPAETESVYEEIARLEQLARINLVVQQMPPGMQAVFLLTWQEGLSIDEIAAKLSISVKTVRNQKYRSLMHLRSRLGYSVSSLGALLFYLHK